MRKLLKLEQNIFNAIEEILGTTHATNYIEGGAYFNAVIESNVRGNIFIESVQFVSSRGERAPVTYKVMHITKSGIKKLNSFDCKYEALLEMEQVITGARYEYIPPQHIN